MLRALIALIVLAAVLYSGYWFIGSQATARAAQDWLEDRRDDGWQVEYADLETKGFPNRFDTTVTNLELTDPDTGVSWSAPFFQVLSLSYEPNHLIVIWPQNQNLATPHQKIDITAEEMKASLRVKPTSEMELVQSNFVAAKAELKSTLGWTSRVDAMNLAIRELADKPDPNQYQIAVDIAGLVPGDALKDLFGAQPNLPETIEAVKVDAEIGFSEPISKNTVENKRPDITNLKINEARGNWGELQLRIAGDLQVDADGIPTGELDLNARQWREMLGLAVQAGALSQEVASGAEFALGLLARASGNENTLDIPLSFEGGRTYLGPIPIGEAPKIRIR